MIWGIVIGIIAGAVAGVVMGMVWKRKKISEIAGKQYDSQPEEQKAAKLAELREYIAGVEGKITNDMVQEKLKVSDATAERYLNELEKEGVLEQIGFEGRSVHYRKK